MAPGSGYERYKLSPRDAVWKIILTEVVKAKNQSR